MLMFILFLLFSLCTFQLLLLLLPTLPTLQQPTPYAGAIGAVMNLAYAGWAVVGGTMSDRVQSRTKVIFYSSCALGIVWLPAFYFFNFGSVFITAVYFFIITMVLGGIGGPLPAWMCELFPSASRYTAIALGYNISQAVFGGTAPVVLTAIAHHDPSEANVFCGVYLFCVTLVTCGFLLLVMYLKKKMEKR
mmetsp:Transcript_15648/g.24482  ORF Transcript_15648/g.24482 Transcript_15648/m.24482 type:complete len:191 (+) Transcript_15648:947-1519(+)